MAGMKFEYDESGGKFYYFFLSFYALILLPTTYWLWPRPEQKKGVSHPEDTSNFAPCRDKYKLIYASQPNQKRRQSLRKLGFVIAWIVLVFFAYRVSLIETEHKDYDPFAILNVDQESSTSEIKRAYHELSKKHHPDRGGDPEKFKEIAKAYKTLTDEEAKENWKKYGNPDGPGVTHFGIALPKWLVDHQNALFVLLIYAGVFMIILPVILCIWGSKSKQYAGDQILNETASNFFAFIRMTSLIPIKRALMILSLASEFNRMRNPMIIERPSDNTDIPRIIRQMPDAQEKPKGRFQFPYSVKARVLLNAHLRRLETLNDNLVKDQQYIVKRSTYLLSEMINIEAQLVAMKNIGQISSTVHIDTIENTMKLSAMIVQGLLGTKSPLLQLPHITQGHLRYLNTKKRSIKTIQQFASINNEERRSMLRGLTDEQYTDVMDAVSIYPYVTMDVKWGVFDDENEHKIAAEDVVTLTVHLQRENVSSLFSKETNSNSVLTGDANDLDDKASEAAKAPKKLWNSKSDKKKKSAKKKGQSKPAKPANKTPVKESSDDDDDSSKHSQDSPQPATTVKEDGNESENEDENINTETNEPSDIPEERDDDEFLEKFQQQQRKREKLETKARISHRVFCPFYPEIKQERWWLYVADKKNRILITAPIYICSLKDKDEFELQFKAPKTQGHYDYCICLRSDSYFGVDVVNNFPIQVEAARTVDANHPQWNFGEDEGGNNPTAEDDEYGTESDSDTE